MGRSLQNTMVNLGIQSACDEALYQVGAAEGLQTWSWPELERRDDVLEVGRSSICGLGQIDTRIIREL